MAPPQLPGDAPVPANGGGGVVGGRNMNQAVEGDAPACALLSFSPNHPPTSRALTHRMLSIQACHVR